MTDESQDVRTSRRQGDVVLEQVRGELAVLSKAVDLGAKATDEAIARLTETAKRLEDKLDKVLEAQADPAASAGGRALLEKIDELEVDRDSHGKRIENLEGFRTEAQTAFRTLRVTLGIVCTLLGIVIGALSVYVAIHPPGPPGT